ncbi:MAG: response regulator [Deltaproteobacteria bacterium]|nr:response regulator [Deltaproteobacteria bacterium]MBW2139232.1 response regulator [Deltaproteobacteria bacterium]
MKTRVLLVDDEKHFVELLAERLALRGYDVETTLSGEEAVDKIEHYNYDVIILDVAMPGMDGVETLREIKRRKPLIEVIMLTGHATVESAVEGMKLGALDYVMKPCDMEDLVLKIETAREKKAKKEESLRQDKVRKILSSPRSVLKEE